MHRRLLLLLLTLVQVASGYNERPLARGIPKPTKDLFNREWDKNIKDVRGKLSIYDKFVPVIGNKKNNTIPFLQKRQELFNAGVYPGVEYRVLAILVEGNDGKMKTLSTLQNYTSTTSDPNVVLVVRPAYPLIPELERDWPVDIEIKSIPFVLTRGAYNLVTVLGSSGIAISFLITAFITSLLLTFSVVNSKSMMPSIQPKDVILVEKISPILRRTLHFNFQENSVVFFKPPVEFEKYLQRNSLPPIGDSALVVKRIKHSSAVAESKTCVSVLGDNGPASLDSRFWGCLPYDNIVGSPLLRIYPLNRIGVISSVVPDIPSTVK
jgi:signal peptidase I